MVKAYKKAPAQRGPGLLFGAFFGAKKKRITSMKMAATRLREPAITTGCQLWGMSLINRPEVLQSIAQQKTAPWPFQRFLLSSVIY
jgi:hypothetical protein